MDELGAPAIEALRERRVRFHPESQHRFAIESLEQAPDWCISRQLWWGHQIPVWTLRQRAPGVRLAATRVVPRVRVGKARARSRRARHVVLVGALAARDARLARRDARARALLPGRRQRHRTRDHPALGEPDDLLGPLPARRDPVHGRDHHLDDPRPRRAADVEEPRHGDRPDGADRVARRGRDPLRAPQDLVDPGRALLRRRDRGGPPPREQALERRAADPPADRGRRAGRAPVGPRGALDPRSPRRGARRRSRTRGAASTSPPRRTCCTT